MTISPKSSPKPKMQLRLTSRSASGALEARTTESGPNSSRVLRSNYRDTLVQAEEENGCWYSTSLLSTPKKGFLSLRKHLLARQCKIRGSFGQYPGFATSDQRGNVESTSLIFRMQEIQSAVPTEESSSVRNQSSADSSRTDSLETLPKVLTEETNRAGRNYISGAK